MIKSKKGKDKDDNDGHGALGSRHGSASGQFQPTSAVHPDPGPPSPHPKVVATTGTGTAAGTASTRTGTSTHTGTASSTGTGTRTRTTLAIPETDSTRAGIAEKRDSDAVTADSNILSDGFPLVSPNSLRSVSSNTPNLSFSTPMTPQDLSPSLLLPLLHCPLCSPAALLTAPTTLHCGHSLCSFHVRSTSRPARTPTFPVNSPPILPTCPHPACSSTPSIPQPSLLPNIPSTSTVTYVPPPPQHPIAPPRSAPTTVPDPKVDVTLSKLLSLVSRAQGWVDDDDSTHEFVTRGYHTDSDDATDNDNDDDEHTSPTTLEYLDPPLPSTSSSSIPIPAPLRTPTIHPRSQSSSPSQQRPRKRRRRHLHPESHDDPHQDEPDLLTHLRQQSARQRTIRHDQPLLAPGFGGAGAGATANSGATGALARFEKELLSELSCEICFTLFYQPVTTPCQHVRFSSFISIPANVHTDVLLKMSPPLTRPQHLLSPLPPGPPGVLIFSRSPLQQSRPKPQCVIIFKFIDLKSHCFIKYAPRYF